MVRELTSGFEVFEKDSLPIFLLGGPSRDKVVVVAVNPGESLDGEQEQARRLDFYRSLHENAFVEIPRLLAAARVRARGTPEARGIKSTSPFWGALHRCVSIFAGNGDVPAGAAERWRYYARTCVVQDLIPFHSRSAKDIPLSPTGPLGEIATAAFDGIATSQARCALVASRQGYRLLECWAARHGIRPRYFTVEGQTRKGKQRRVQAFTTELGRLRVVAIDNALVTQPTFPWAAGYREQLAEAVQGW